MSKLRHYFLGLVVAETNKAVRFLDWFWAGPLWFPKSQVIIVRGVDTDECEIRCTDWFSRQSGVREFVEYDAKDIERLSEVRDGKST